MSNNIREETNDSTKNELKDMSEDIQELDLALSLTRSCPSYLQKVLDLLCRPIEQIILYAMTTKNCVH